MSAVDEAFVQLWREALEDPGVAEAAGELFGPEVTTGWGGVRYDVAGMSEAEVVHEAAGSSFEGTDEPEGLWWACGQDEPDEVSAARGHRPSRWSRWRRDLRNGKKRKVAYLGE